MNPLQTMLSAEGLTSAARDLTATFGRSEVVFDNDYGWAVPTDAETERIVGVVIRWYADRLRSLRILASAPSRERPDRSGGMVGRMTDPYRGTDHPEFPTDEEEGK